jgi:hypothetical protein
MTTADENRADENVNDNCDCNLRLEDLVVGRGA